MKENELRWDEIYKWNKMEQNYLVYPDEEVVRILKKEFIPNNVKKVLDIGCGSGRHSLAMLKEGLEVYAIDSSSTSLSIAKKLCDGCNKKIFLKEGSVTAIPYAEDSFDGVLCWGILHYLSPDEVQKALKEIHRILKPRGYFALTLRSSADSEAQNKDRDQEMIISSARESKGLHFKYYDEKDIVSTLSLFKNVKWGHKTRTFLGDTRRVFAHWFIISQK